MTITLLPGCLYPYRRYPLEIIQVAIRVRFVDKQPWRSAGFIVGVYYETVRDWCSNFTQAAVDWLTGLIHWFAHLLEFISTAGVEQSHEVGLLGMAGLCMGLQEQENTGIALADGQILQRLWEWGFERLNRIPLLSTRFPEGGSVSVRPRGRDPDP
jgi:hypothetical protein